MNEQSERSRLSLWDRTIDRKGASGGAHSRFVRRMRLLLPLMAVGITGIVMAWPRLSTTLDVEPQKPVESKSLAGSNELVNPRFESTDSENRPFSITSARAVQSASDPALVMLEKPRGEMVLENGVKLEISAASGSYRQNEERLFLEGDVRLHHGDGYEITTEKLLVQMKDREAWSDRPVHGQGPAGTLDATGTHVRGADEVIVFTGPARLVLNEEIRGL